MSRDAEEDRRGRVAKSLSQNEQVDTDEMPAPRENVIILLEALKEKTLGGDRRTTQGKGRKAWPVASC